MTASRPAPSCANTTLHARSTLSPRVAVSTVVSGATFVASLGKFSQPPDLQYLVDAAFDDTTRTGRFRQGNPNLGFESAMQYELSARIRLPSGNSLKINIYDKHLDGLVASVPINVNPDSSVFVNADVGTVTGARSHLRARAARRLGRTGFRRRAARRGHGQQRVHHLRPDAHRSEHRTTRSRRRASSSRSTTIAASR